MPLVNDLPFSEPYEEPYLEVRLLPDGEVVTVIDSCRTPTSAPVMTASYLEKRTARSIAPSTSSTRPVARPRTDAFHRARNGGLSHLVRWRELGRRAHLYAFTLRQPFPFSVAPLAGRSGAAG